MPQTSDLSLRLQHKLNHSPQATDMLDASNIDIIAAQDVTPLRDIAIYWAQIIAISLSIAIPCVGVVVYALYRYIVRSEKRHD